MDEVEELKTIINKNTPINVGDKDKLNQTVDDIIRAGYSNPLPADGVNWPKKKFINKPDDEHSCNDCFNNGWNACHDAFMKVIKENKNV